MGFLTPESASLYICSYQFYLKKKGQNRFLHSDQIIQILSLKSLPTKIHFACVSHSNQQNPRFAGLLSSQLPPKEEDKMSSALL